MDTDEKHFLSALLMGLFLAACGNGDGEETADAGDSENVTDETVNENEEDSGTDEETASEVAQLSDEEKAPLII